MLIVLILNRTLASIVRISVLKLKLLIIVEEEAVEPSILLRRVSDCLLIPRLGELRLSIIHQTFKQIELVYIQIHLDSCYQIMIRIRLSETY